MALEVLVNSVLKKLDQLCSVAENTAIRKAINHHMENFSSNKEHMIKSILKHLFHKVVLDYLVVDNKLVIDPDEVKLKVDKIMKE
ncbi:hypothetical protein G9A89_019292 [Geosiphon pyriformis]|nr:hypothetical protein G9A89_019292 [Geosiphon pyriformis]